MNNWKVIFATVIIFGAGVMTGGLLVNYVQHSRPKPVHRLVATAESRPGSTNQSQRQVEAGKARLPDVLSKQFLQRLDEELHLASNQREAIQKIIGEGQNQMRKVIVDARLEIREVLSPVQRKVFDELVKRPVRKSGLGTNGPAALPPGTNLLAR